MKRNVESYKYFNWNGVAINMLSGSNSKINNHVDINKLPTVYSFKIWV